MKSRLLVLACMFLLSVVGLVYAEGHPEVFVQTGHLADAGSVAFSSDGQWVLSGGSGTVKLWEVATGREVRTFTGISSYVRSVALSPSGEWALAGSWDGAVKLWDVATGREVRSFMGHGYEVRSVAFSLDGRWALSGSGDRTVKIWEVATGREVRSFMGHTAAVNSVALSPDGRWALSGGEDGRVKLWEVATGREVRTLERTYDVKSVAFSPDGRWALSGSVGAGLKLWAVTTGQEVRKFKGYWVPVYSMALSLDGHWALLGSSDGAVSLWEVATGREVRTFTGHKVMVTAVAFSPDGRWALSGSDDGAMKLWEVATGREVRSFMGHLLSDLRSVAFSPDGQWALSGSGDQTMKLWEVATGREIRAFSGHRLAVNSVAFSPDGRWALMGSVGGAIWLWEVATGREVRTFTGHSYDVRSVAFSPDGRWALSGSGDRTVKLWEVATGREVRTFTGHSSDVWSAAFSPDGRWVLSGSLGGELKLWEVATGREVRSFIGHGNSVRSVALSPDGSLAVSGGMGMNVWRVASGEELLTTVLLGDREWISLTPEGYYAASPKGDNYLNVRLGNQVYGIDQFRSTFYRPQIVEATLRLGNREQAIAEILGEGDKRATGGAGDFIAPPTVAISSPEDRSVLATPRLDLAVTITDKSYPIQSVRVSRNGAQVWPLQTRDLVVTAKSGVEKAPVVPGTVPAGVREWTTAIPLDLEEGENVIEVKAFNGHSETVKAITVSLPASLVPHDDVIKPNLWILSIGINAYQDRQIRALSYAEADAQAIVQAFTQQRGKLFRDVRSLIISDSSTMKPTYDTILDNLGYLRQAGQNDVVLLFLAGHGINDDRGEFYFLPSDAAIQSDGSIKRSRAISNDEIKKVLDLPAKKIVFLDACHSEGVSKKKTRGVDNNRFIKELQAMDAVILTSSAGNELSQEGDAWKHGAFTYALLEGLSGKADLITKDGIVSMKELDGYVSERVPHLTNGAQHPITDTPGGYRNFPVALLR